MTDPIQLLRELLRFDTTNPPGNEAPCIDHIHRLLRASSIETTLFARDPMRPNLIARIPGTGAAPPLLLEGHVDVVPTHDQRWRHPPFAAHIDDGFVWGRGALDMKSGVAMMVMAMLQAAERHLRPHGDVILCVVSDEEAGSAFGTKYLVEEHPELFQDVRYAIGEGSMHSLTYGGQRFYPINVAERQGCWMELVIEGEAGHASVPLKNGVLERVAHALTRIINHRFEVRPPAVTIAMINGMCDVLPEEVALHLRRIVDPDDADVALEDLGPHRSIFESLLRDTVVPTVIRSGDKVNVHPARATIQLDGRLLPGTSPDEIISSLTRLLDGLNTQLRVTFFDPYPEMQVDDFYAFLAHIVQQEDPTGTPVPSICAGVTDARFLIRLGIKTYGFTPIPLPLGVSTVGLVHAADERVPIDGLDLGVRCLYRLLEEYRDI